MTRINTNVSSLNAQKSLARSNVSLQQALTRLSTGLRINEGKDDPAGLIASETLRSDITAVSRAISNSQRANQMIATADSALGQVSALLNDIRGLVTEAANDGVMSEEQIAANQLQIDSSLEAINRIAQTTTFQGRRVLDGSLDLITTGGTGFDTVSRLQIDQANLGATGQVDVSVEISTAAAQAQITNAGIAASTAGVRASDTLTFSDNIAAQQANAVLTLSAPGSSLNIGVKAGSPLYDGANGNGINVVFAEDNTTAAHAASFAANTITITVGTLGAPPTVTAASILAAFNADVNVNTHFEITAASGDYTPVTDIGPAGALANGANAIVGDDVITIRADAEGVAANGVQVNVIEAAGHGLFPSAAFNGTNIEVTVDDNLTSTIAQIANAINGLAGYSAFISESNGDGNYVGAIDAPPSALLGGGIDPAGGLTADLVVQISGTTGSEVFNFVSGTSLTQIVDAINLVSDATGVEAADDSGTLNLTATGYGSRHSVAVDVLQEGIGGTFADDLSAERAIGTDVVARVNGIQANGDGNTLSINTSTLDLLMTVTDGSETDVSLSITGGGALIQLGPDVVSNQQARIGIQSLNTASLQGDTGRLYELASGGDAALDTNTTRAAEIVDDVITQVTSLRGRLGAFQRTTLDTNIASLSDTMENLTEAESSIRDADFAVETAALTRAQILVQSGLSVLTIANSNPQNVLALLR